MKAGLVSISFRKLSVAQIVDLCVKCGLTEIEWGGDIHVPLGDTEAAGYAYRLTEDAGLHVSCYGSYVRMTLEERPLLPVLAETARALHAPMIRVWAGKSEDADLEEIAESTRMLCDLVPELAVSYEFHGGTLTHGAGENALALLKAVDRPNVRCQWQPHVNMSPEDCLATIEAIRPYLGNVHIFSWNGRERLPLAAHEDRWLSYLDALRGERTGLLEFVQNDDPENLVRDAACLRRWLERGTK